MPEHKKPERVKLKRNSVAWKRLVNELYEREDGVCQSCERLMFPDQAAPHHKKTVGSGGSDTLTNLELLCTECHFKVHSGEIVRCMQCNNYTLRNGKCRHCGFCDT